jgi:hypothetical protein
VLIHTTNAAANVVRIWWRQFNPQHDCCYSFYRLWRKTESICWPVFLY